MEDSEDRVEPSSPPSESSAGLPSLMDSVEIERVRSKSRSVWMRSLRYHTFHGDPQPEGAIYIAHEDEVENIENLKFAVRETPPMKAVREP